MVFDEIKLQQGLVFSAATNSFIGFVDVTDIEAETAKVGECG